MFRFFYSLLAYSLLPFVFLRLLCRSIKQPAYRRRWAERLGFIPNTTRKTYTFWLHAVSVGEVGAAVPLIHQLQKDHPEVRWLVTTTTPTGSEQVKRALKKTVRHYYAPYDFPSAVKRFIRRAKPDLLIIMETELWPNLIHHCHRQNIPILLANARLSHRSAKKYNRFARVTRRILNQITMIAAQYQQDALRFMALGVQPAQVMVGGNLKFHRPIPKDCQQKGQALKGKCGHSRPIWLAASTRRGEEVKVIEAFKEVLRFSPQTVLMLAPRHPERFDQVAKQLDQHGIPYRRLSQLKQSLPKQAQCLLIDQMGHLLPCYAAADMAFVGGSLVPCGGQNILEAAAMGTAIITGPHMYNFETIYQMLCHAKACATVHDEHDLAEVVIDLMQKPQQCTEMGEMGRAIFDDNQDALGRHYRWIEQYFFAPKEELVSAKPSLVDDSGAS